MTVPQYVVTFKDEDEINGEPIGPVEIYTLEEVLQGVEGSFGVPYQPGRARPWYTLAQAQQIAEDYGTTLERV